MHPLATYHMAQAIHVDRQRTVARRQPSAHGATQSAHGATQSRHRYAPQRRLAVAMLTLVLSLSVGTAIAAANPIPPQAAPGPQVPL